MEPPLFKSLIQKIDEANARDPNTEKLNGKLLPEALVYGRRMSGWLEKIKPDAGDALRLAARAQHICRWQIPRSNYPMDRAGYLKWRTELYGFHAEKAAEVLREAGSSEDLILRVKELLKKKNIKTDPEMQLLEDVICLVFLENYFADFSKKHDREKMITIIQKTWKKMSEEGRAEALRLPMPPDARALVEEALKT